MPIRKRKSKVTKLPARRTPLPSHEPVQKLSELIKDMAFSLLKDPDGIPSPAAAQAALLLASVAWNSTIGDPIFSNEYR